MIMSGSTRRILHVPRAFSTSSVISSSACSGVTRALTCALRNSPCSLAENALLNLLEHRRLEVAREPRARGARAPTRTVVATARYGFSRPLPPSARSISPARSEHLDVEVQVAGVDPEPLRELAVRERLVALAAEHLEHAQPQRMAEGLELLGSLDRQDVAGGRGRGLRHVEAIYRNSATLSSLAAAARSSRAIVSPSAERRRLAGVAGSGAPANARATASAFVLPDDEEDHLLRAARASGSVIVTRSTSSCGDGDRPALALVECGRAREERSRVAVGPDPWSASPSCTPSSSRSYSAAAGSPPSSPRMRCTSDGCRSIRSSSVRLTSR